MSGEQAFLAADLDAGVSAFDVVYLDDERVERRAPLRKVAESSFEAGPPVRDFPSYKGQKNNAGLWWSATMQSHVGYESWLERDHLMLLDFDPSVAAVSSQPFWLVWSQLGQERKHAPDYFVRTVDGRGAVIDCRPADRIRGRDQEAFDATANACAQVGWIYRLVGVPDDPVFVSNVRWLGGYRHPRHHRMDIATRLVEIFSRPHPLLEGAQLAGEPIAVLPVVYHLLWSHVLETDLSSVLCERSEVVCGGGR